LRWKARTASVEILPKLQVELGLIADRLKPGCVGVHPARDAGVRLLRYATRYGFRPELGDPLLERGARAFRAGGFRQHEAGKRPGDGLL